MTLHSETIRIKPYDPTTPKEPKKRLRQENVIPPDNTAKRPRFLTSTSDAMATTLIPTVHDFVDVHAMLSPADRMNLALRVLDIGGLSITELLMHRLTSAGTRHFENSFLSEGGGLEIFLKGLIGQCPAAQDRIFRAVGHKIALKTVSAKMEVVKSHTLLSSAEITPHSMRDWTVGIPKHLAPCLSSILHAGAVSDRATKENKTKKDTFTVSVTTFTFNGKKYVS